MQGVAALFGCAAVNTMIGSAARFADRRCGGSAVLVCAHPCRCWSCGDRIRDP